MIRYLQFLKKHYEKIILSAVLLALAATAIWFAGAVREAGQTPESSGAPAPKQKPWVPLSLSNETAALEAFSHPPALDLSVPQLLFNSVTWKRMRDGSLAKITREGPSALVVTKITPRYYTIAFDRQASEAYQFTVTAEPDRPRSFFLRLNEPDKSKPFTVTATAVAPDGAVNLTLTMTSGETVTVSTNSPYKRISSYTVDFQYPPDAMVFPHMQINQNLMLSDTRYKIIAITNDTVTVEDTKSAKPTTIKWSGQP